MPAAVANPPAAPRQDAAGIVAPAAVPASSIAPPVEPTSATPGSAKDAMFKTLREKYSKPAPGSETNPPAPEPTAKPAAGEPAKAGTPDPGKNAPSAGQGEPQPATPPSGEPGEGTPAGETARPEKPTKDFWRSYDAWKERATKAETEIVKLKESITPETDRKQFLDRVTKAEARAKELEDHIRFVDYSKSQEFQDKYQKPYVQAWERAMSEISQISVVDTAGGPPRPATSSDLYTLVNLPLGEARAMAKEVFGDFADDVMAYRKEIRALNDAQHNALEEAKKSSADRMKVQTEEQARVVEQLNSHIKKVWDKANELALADPDYGKFFKPVEGNQEINQRLAKGFDMVNRVFTEDPRDPKWTPEERASIVKRHAAVRNRAAAFGRVYYELKQTLSKLEAAEKELEGYKKSTPRTTGQPSGQPATGAQSAWGSIREGLSKIARPG